MMLLKGDKPVATTPRSTFVFNLAPQKLEAAQRLRWVISEHIQLDCGPDPTSPDLRASSASFVKIFFPAMRPDSQAPVI